MSQVAHRLDIIRTDALLAVSEPGACRVGLSEKTGGEGVHTGRVAPFLEERQVHGAQLVRGQALHPASRINTHRSDPTLHGFPLTASNDGIRSANALIRLGIRIAVRADAGKDRTTGVDCANGVCLFSMWCAGMRHENRFG